MKKLKYKNMKKLKKCLHISAASPGGQPPEHTAILNIDKKLDNKLGDAIQI